MPLASPDLDAAFEACRRETAEWAKTFYIGTLLLPPEKRRAIWAIYVWCRRTDELMDSPEAQARPVKELAERLDRWEEKTRALFDGRINNPLPGAALLAARTGAPLLPVAICNSHRALGSGRSWPRLVPIQLRIGDPIPAPASRRRPDLDATTALLQERINALLDQGPQHP